MSLVKLKILSPDKPVADVAADSVSLPGSQGYLQILPGHAPMIAELGVGEVYVKRPGESHLHYFIAGGYVEATPDSVVVLVDVIESKGDVDIERAHRAEKRALERLAQKDPSLNVARALESLKRAQERLVFARKT
jgi:F-type H+-transporting ATPase subunit epsilon